MMYTEEDRTKAVTEISSAISRYEMIKRKMK